MMIALFGSGFCLSLPKSKLLFSISPSLPFFSSSPSVFTGTKRKGSKVFVFFFKFNVLVCWLFHFLLFLISYKDRVPLLKSCRFMLLHIMSQGVKPKKAQKWKQMMTWPRRQSPPSLKTLHQDVYWRFLFQVRTLITAAAAAAAVAAQVQRRN